jgi:AraC-like DNA-binding protein
MDDKKKIIVERIKTCITEKLNSSSTKTIEEKLSTYLSSCLHYHYTYLSNIFSEMENCTLERYYIEERIERVKELMVYEDMPVKEISYLLNYSSVPHLCLQFKKVTGLTPSQFKKLCLSDEFVWRNLDI